MIIEYCMLGSMPDAEDTNMPKVQQVLVCV